MSKHEKKTLDIKAVKLAKEMKHSAIALDVEPCLLQPEDYLILGTNKCIS